MIQRKPNRAEQLAELRNELDTCEKFMKPLVAESEKLDEIAKERPLTLEERRRLNELIDIIHAKNVWLAKAKETIRQYCAPASA